MQIKKLMVCTGMLLFLCLTSALSYAQMIGNDGLGQTIQIYTRLRSFVGKPSWLIIIRDLDNNQTIPYLFDITQGNNFWLLFTYSRNFLIQASNLQISAYKPHCNEFHRYRINNFCHLESNGRIIRGESLSISIEGDLTPSLNQIRCNMTSFPDTHFTVGHPG